ncbi:hypothetical protein [Alkaliphilus sp. B6464]|uniref:hypothetical protein n=1 Tax=Alkaliphilus sp. B6464 TaxID=2731219 RepID=UPI001BA50C1D|nr:hypothetical protein [Alkaliphilus sp. B6464]QUH19478.1 hypothetical protein HYG84_05975 [Alkaliphilus sp. B6464]
MARSKYSAEMKYNILKLAESSGETNSPFTFIIYLPPIRAIHISLPYHEVFILEF